MDVTWCIRRLEAGATIFKGLLRGVTREQARWRPAEDQWSILEVVCHLADEEVEDFRLRLDLTLHRTGEAWPSIDPEGWVHERGYNHQDLSEALQRFLAERDNSLVWLSGLEEADWSASREHPSMGTLTAGDLLTSWVAHDMIHVRQINRLHRLYLTEVASDHAPDYAGRW